MIQIHMLRIIYLTALFVSMTAIFAPVSRAVQTAESNETFQQADSSGPGPERILIVGGVTLGGFVYGHALQNDLWWKGERSDFHFNWEADWEYALGADKMGHAFFPYLVTNVYRDLFTWSGVDTVAAVWLAGGLAFSYQSYIEVRDGFSAEWGFSWGDMGANFVGAAWPVAQHYWPALDAARLKISFNPTDDFRGGSHAAIIDDYESTTHWISLGVHDMLPDAWRGYWPRWLRIALGHSVRGLDGTGGGEHLLYLALDYGIADLPGEQQPWRAIKNLLEFYHLPSPAIRIYPNVVWYGLRL